MTRRAIMKNMNIHPDTMNNQSFPPALLPDQLSPTPHSNNLNNPVYSNISSTYHHMSRSYFLALLPLHPQISPSHFLQYLDHFSLSTPQSSSPSHHLHSTSFSSSPSAQLGNSSTTSCPSTQSAEQPPIFTTKTGFIFPRNTLRQDADYT